MIAARGLTKFYGDRCAVDDLTFEIAEGEIVGLLGLNGAGKTTALRVLACLLLPSSGKVQINGRDIVENPHETRQMVGFLPDTPPLYGEMTVEAYLTFAGELRGLSRERTRERLEEVLRVTHIADVRRQVIESLSHGYRQRVGIAQAVIHAPPVLILDEPITGLDPAQIKEVREMIRSLAGKHTIILSSHILAEISQTCDRILVLHEGKLVAQGRADELARGSVAKRVHLSVRGDRAQAIELVKKVDGVTGCRVLDPGVAVSDDDTSTVHHLQIDTSSDLREVLAREVVQGGLGLLQLRPADTELESTFLQLTHSTRGGNDEEVAR